MFSVLTLQLGGSGIRLGGYQNFWLQVPLNFLHTYMDTLYKMSRRKILMIAQESWTLMMSLCICLLHTDRSMCCIRQNVEKILFFWLHIRWWWSVKNVSAAQTESWLLHITILVVRMQKGDVTFSTFLFTLEIQRDKILILLYSTYAVPCSFFWLYLSWIS